MQSKSAKCKVQSAACGYVDKGTATTATFTTTTTSTTTTTTATMT